MERDVSFVTDGANRGGSADSIVAIKMMLEWLEGERIRLKAQNENLLNSLHGIAPLMAEAKRSTWELLADKDDELRRMRMQLDE